MKTLAIFLLLFGYGISAARHTDEKSERSVVPRDPMLAKLMTLGGKVYASDPPGAMSFEFIGPNESFGNLFEPCLKLLNGALLTVGTFRGLNNASSGKIKQLVQMDYNRGVYLFNLINAQLIAKSADRYEYLSLLLTGEVQQALIKEAKDKKWSVSQFAKVPC